VVGLGLFAPFWSKGCCRSASGEQFAQVLRLPECLLGSQGQPTKPMFGVESHARSRRQQGGHPIALVA